MNKNSFILKFNPGFSTLLLIYLVLGFFVIKYYQYEGIWGDSLAYISIAQKYVRGDFENAINGFWPPLFSWLLAPFLYFFGSTPLSSAITAKVLILIIGLFTITGIRILSYRFEMTEKIRSIISFLLIPIILSFVSFEEIVPDLLLLCILVYYLNIVFNNNYPERTYNGILSGVLGALVYFSKPYGFPFFISHFILINTFHYFRNTTIAKRKAVLRNAFVGIALFSIISGVWIIIISNKYNYVTFSTAGKENYSIVAPGVEGPPHSHHLYNEGFYTPPNETAINIFEDLSYINVESWNPLESWNSFKHQIWIILKNTRQIIHIFWLFSPLSIAIIVVYILFCIQPFSKILQRGDLLYPLLTIILYSGGYTIPFVSPRYIWIDNILLLLMGGYLLNVLFQNKFFNNTRKTILILFFIISFIAWPLKGIIQKPSIGEEMYTLSKKLENYNMRGNIASHRPDPTTVGPECRKNISLCSSWLHTLTLSYYLNTRYYGQARENISDKELESELRKYDIDYYFVWGESNNTPHFLSNYRELTGGEISGLEIYSLKGGNQI